MLESASERVVGGTRKFLIGDQVYDGCLPNASFAKDDNIWSIALVENAQQRGGKGT